MLPPRVPEPPARVAVSLIDPVTRTVGVASVVRIGVTWVTTLVSPRSLQAVAVAALLVDRKSVVQGRWVAAWLGVIGYEIDVPAPPPELTTVLGLVKIAALPQVASFGP